MRFLPILFGLLIVSGACAQETPTATPTAIPAPTATSTPTPTPTATPTATPIPPTPTPVPPTATPAYDRQAEWEKIVARHTPAPDPMLVARTPRPTEPPFAKQNIEQAQLAIVKTRHRTDGYIYHGTGTLILHEDRVFVVTTFHGVAPCSPGAQVHITHVGTNYGYYARCVAHSKSNDIAILNMPDNMPDSALEAMRLYAIPLSQSTSATAHWLSHRNGDPIQKLNAKKRYSSEFICPAEFNVSLGYIDYCSGRFFIYEVKSRKGDSGSPFVDNGGNLKAVHVAGSPGDTPPLSFSTPASNVQELIEDYLNE